MKDPYQQLMEKGKAATAQGDFEAAKACFEKAIELDPNNPDPYVDLGNTYKNSNPKELDEAEQWYLRALKLNETYWRAHHNLGLVFQKRKDYEKAFEYLTQALETNPNPYITLNSLGNVYSHMGKHPEALETYQKAIELEPENYIAKYNLGAEYTKINQLEKAIEILTAIENITPPYRISDLYFHLAESYYKLENDKKAILYYKKLNELQPEHDYYWARLIRLYVLTEKFKKGSLTAEKALLMFPDSAYILLYYSIHLTGIEKYPEAITAIKRAISLVPNIPNSHLVLAALLEATNQWDMAVSEFWNAYRCIDNSHYCDLGININQLILYLESKDLSELVNAFREKEKECSGRCND